jgi:shikimate dehydrogenase
MSVQINKDTKVYGSFSSNPGNNGCEFFNEAFERNNINAIYKSFYSDNIERSVDAVKSLGIKGFAVSIPFKESVLEYVNRVDITALHIGAANTIINDNGVLTAYNTDWIGVYNFFKDSKLTHINIIGSGGFSKAIMYAFAKLKISFSIVTRNDIPTIDNVSGQYFINATPADIQSNLNTIIDARPHTNDGKLIAKLQSIEQFKLYTEMEYENT